MNKMFFKRKMEDKDRQAVSYLPELSRAEAELLFAETETADLEELLAAAKERKYLLKKRCEDLKKQKDKIFFQACFYRNLLNGEFKQAVEYLFNGTVSPEMLSEAVRKLQPREREGLKAAFESKFLPLKESFAQTCNCCQMGLQLAKQLEAETMRARLQKEYEKLQTYYKFL